MIRSALKELFPVARLPESEALHVVVIVTHRRIGVWSTLDVKVNKLLEVGSNNLVGVYEEDFLEVHREENVQEQDLVRPDDSLLLLLLSQPGRPLVCYKFILEPIFFGEVRDKFLALLLEKTDERKEDRNKPGKTEKGSFR